ncbi:hypothetical protein M9Y10_025652 [Tritrichomonas musculus]|uniref:Polycystin cation channel PKD1/PKD2 domain-containing protein n=1 Tax=Tritrichomonas musculus TaxID=1915356 RepID=A0ABR2HAK9_9EUKA
MLYSLLLPSSKEKKIAFSSIISLQKGIENCLINIERIYKDSFQNFYFENQSYPVIFKTHWLNGSITESADIEISTDLFHHISSFGIFSAFMLMIEDGDITGCTQWSFEFNVHAGLGSYLFYLEPKLKRSWCPSYIVNSSPTKSISIPHHNFASTPYFERKNLSLYSYLVKYGTLLLSISTFYLISLLISLSRVFKLHKKLMQTDPQYEDMTPYEQFHSTIGFWKLIGVLTEVVMILGSVSFLNDSLSFTQFISPRTRIIFGFSALFSITTVVQWLHFIPSCYCIVLIIRQAFGTLLLVVIGIFPIAISMAFVAIFLFGYASEVTESIVTLLENLLSITFGDMISDFYLAFTDGSSVYNALSFVFATISTAVAMWLFFTSFTAQMASIYIDNVSHLIMGDNENKEEE